MEEQIIENLHPSLLNYDLTDDGNSLRLVSRYRDRIRFNHTAGQWLVWDGKRWKRDSLKEVQEFAKETIRVLLQEASNAHNSRVMNFASSSQSASRIAAMMRLAESDPGVAVDESSLDSDPNLFNMNNGILNVRTGEFLPHQQSYNLTKITTVDYDPAAGCPRWLAFLDKVFQSDNALIQYVQKCVGVSLVGPSEDQKLFFLYGEGQNGKTTFIETLRMLFGEYFQKAPQGFLMKRNSGAIPNDIARLKGARFVAASETDEGSKWDEARVKDLTGGDIVTARFLYREHFQFVPTFNIWIYGNHRPDVRGQDYGIWRRIKVIPLTYTFTDAERRNLPEVLDEFKSELSGIFNWALAGYALYRAEGLSDPPAVAHSIREYRNESDVLRQFIVEKCEQDADSRVKLSSFYSLYRAWCGENNEDTLTRKQFITRLASMGHEMVIGTANVRYIQGLKLRDIMEYAPVTELVS